MVEKMGMFETSLLQAGFSVASGQNRKQLTEQKRLRSCLSSYADGLDGVVEGLGSAIREHPLSVVKTSDRDIVIGPGSGTAGSESAAAALSMLGFHTGHYTYGAPESASWSLLLHGILRQPADECISSLRSFDFTSLNTSIDAVFDTPVAELFLDLYLSFPHAKFVLSVRPPLEWAESRMEYLHGVTPPPMQEPCNLVMGGPEVGGNNITAHAQLFHLNNELVRCVVPQDRLFEIDLAGPTDTVMLELSEFLNVPRLDAEYPHCIGGRQRMNATVQELIAQGPYCPVSAQQHEMLPW